MCLPKVQVKHIPLNTMRKLCISYLKVSHIYIITFCKVMTLSTKKAKVFSALPAKCREDHSFFFFFCNEGYKSNETGELENLSGKV